jgi:hypothetical protein
MEISENVDHFADHSSPSKDSLKSIQREICINSEKIFHQWLVKQSFPLPNCGT